jgi:hypothetical protein
MKDLSSGERGVIVTPSPSLGQRLISFNSIMREPLPPIEWLVEALIVHGNRAVLFGEFGSMKSFLLLHLALHIAAGRPWLGQFSIPQAKSVLYVDEEMSERELRRRVKRLGIGAGLEDLDLPLRAVSHAGLRFDSKQAERLLKELKQADFDPEVVIIETFRRVLIGSENEAADVGGFWLNVSPILAAGKTLIISHHMRKPSPQGTGDSRHRASGSTDILAGADCGYAITRVNGDAITVECVKLRAAEEAGRFALTLRDRPGDDQPLEMRYEGQLDVPEDLQKELERASDLITDYMAGQQGDAIRTGEVIAHLEAQGISKRTAERAWYAFTDVFTEKVGHGWYRLKEQPAGHI